jgi:hypothetical protein
VQHTNPQPRSGAVTYSLWQAESELSQAAVASPNDRRWAIWWVRLGLTAAVAAMLPLLRTELSDLHGRENMLMSALAAGFILVLFLTWSHEAMGKLDRVPRMRIVRSAMTFGASCVAVGMFLGGAQADAIHVRTKAAHLPKALWPLVHGEERPAIHHDHIGLLPRFSAKLSGAAQAPVSLIFLGNGAQLLEAFAAAQWHVADRVTPRTALRAFARGVMNRPYPSAPVLPSFLDGKLHDVAFQRTDDGGSSRRRHHARWWLTDFTVEGKQVWVATASFDAGVGISRIFPLPIHHIHPDIDAERDYIVRSVVAAGRVQVTQEVQVTEPMTGKNAAGDRFFTQGTAFVLA